MLSDTTKGYILAAIAAASYGTNPLFALPLYKIGMNPESVLFFRYMTAIPMLAAMLMMRGRGFGLRRHQILPLVAMGLIMAISSLTLFESYNHMAAGIASTLLFVYPIMTALLMTAFFHEKVTWSTSMAILLAVAGVGMLYQGDGDAKLSTAGFALVMASSLLYSIYIIAVNQWQTTMSSLKFTFWILVFCFIAILVFSWLSGDSLQMLHTPMQWGCALQLALLPTVLSLFFMTISINLIGSTPSAIMGALEPVTAVCIGVLIFGEAFSLRLGIGILLILAGVVLIILRKKKS